MLDWSYNLLSEHEKLVLRRLSVFVGDFTLQSAGSVASEGDVDAADVITAIVDLTEKSLITATEINGSTYYRLLDTTRAYAGAKLIAWPDGMRSFIPGSCNMMRTSSRLSVSTILQVMLCI